MNSGNHLLLMSHKFCLVDKHGHGINAGRHMLKGNALVFQNSQHLSAESHLRIHHRFLYVHGAEALLARDSRDNMAGFPAGILHNQGSLVLRPVSVADMNGDSFLSHRENGILVEYAGPHIGQLSQLLVGHRLNDLRIIHDSGIRHQESGHVRPVLVEIGVDGPGYNGTGDIGTASGKGVDLSVPSGAVKPGNHRPLHMGQALGQLLVGLL